MKFFIVEFHKHTFPKGFGNNNIQVDVGQLPNPFRLVKSSMEIKR